MIGPLTIVSLDQGKIYRQEPVPSESEPGKPAEQQVGAAQTPPGRLALLADWLTFALARRLTA